MSRKRISHAALSSLLHSGHVRRVAKDGVTYFVAVDVLAQLADSEHPEEFWNDLKQREPQLLSLIELVEISPGEAVEAVDLAGVFRIVQSIDSRRADRIKSWMADAAATRIAESDDPELAVLRARRLYESHGYSRQWIDSRMSTVSARQDLAGEWYRRGARESDQFRALTNELIKSAFGMDVEHYRQFKHLRGSSENLRDHMTDLELALTRLAEMTAAALHRDRNSTTFDQLLHDVEEAGEITARTRKEIESRRGKPIVYPGSFAA
jgi:DNA-damage-inducible protein D